MKILLILIPSTLILMYQWYFTFVNNDLFSHPTKTIISPFFVWSFYSPHIVLSLFLSIAFPVVILIFYLKKLDSFLIYSWLTFFVALMMMIFLCEYPHWKSGNYFWGAIAANYILFLFSMNCLLHQPVDWKFKVASAIFGLHFLSGVYYLVSFTLGQTSLLF